MFDDKHNESGSKRSVAEDTEVIAIPSFEELSRMAENEPEAFEGLREQLCRQFIDSAPAFMQRRLTGLQFQIDMERRRSQNPTAACINISRMMNDSLAELGHAIQDPKEYVASNRQYHAEVLSFSDTDQRFG